MNERSQTLTLVGFGAIGRSIFKRLEDLPQVRLTHVVVRPAAVDATQRLLGNKALACSAVPANARLVLECAGHAALTEHVLPALRRGVECAILSVGSLSARGLPEALAAAAREGKTQLHALSGAIGGIDAIAAARQAGLTEVLYTGRKPPASWAGPDLDAGSLGGLTAPLAILESSAREAAQKYPKNANVAATLSLAGLGLDDTRVRLLADPGVTENIHEIEVKGAFGEMYVRMKGKPLPDNPKTSALTVLSAMRFLSNRVADITF